jgi:hypothetical protein
MNIIENRPHTLTDLNIKADVEDLIRKSMPIPINIRWT